MPGRHKKSIGGILVFCFFSYALDCKVNIVLIDTKKERFFKSVKEISQTLLRFPGNVRLMCRFPFPET